MFRQSAMVSISISKFSLMDLIFVHLEVKRNGGYYREMLLSQQLLPMMCYCLLYTSDAADE